MNPSICIEKSIRWNWINKQLRQYQQQRRQQWWWWLISCPTREKLKKSEIFGKNRDIAKELKIIAGELGMDAKRGEELDMWHYSEESNTEIGY